MAVRVPPLLRARTALPIDTVSEGMVRYEISVAPDQVVFVKGLVEAHEGLAGVFAEHGGELVLAAPPGREAEVEELLRDLAGVLAAEPRVQVPHGAHGAPEVLE